MAIDGTLSIQVQDNDKEITAYDLPFVNTSSVLADVLAWVAQVISYFDVIVDTKIMKARICFSVPLPVGLKSVPVVGSEIERTGLITFDTPAVVSSYGNDIPGFAYAKFVGNAINLADADVTNFVDYVRLLNSNTQATDRDGNILGVVKKARKTFRKHRKSTNRV